MPTESTKTFASPTAPSDELATLLLPEPERIEIRVFHHEAEADRFPCDPAQGLVRSRPRMTPFPPDRMLDLVAPDEGGFLQGKAGHRAPGRILDLQADTAGRRGGEVQHQILAFKAKWLADPFSARIPGIHRDKPIGPDHHPLQVIGGKGVVALDEKGDLIGCGGQQAPSGGVGAVGPVAHVWTWSDEGLQVPIPVDRITTGHEDGIGAASGMGLVEGTHGLPGMEAPGQEPRD